MRFSTLSTDFSTINGEYSPRAVENPRLSPFQHFSHNTKWIIHNPQTRTAIAFCGLFHRIHGPYYYYYPRFLSLQSKINSAPQKAHPSRENFLPSLPIKTDKKLSTPAKQVVRAGLQSPIRAEVPAQALISGRRGRPEPAKAAPDREISGIKGSDGTKIHIVLSGLLSQRTELKILHHYSISPKATGKLHLHQYSIHHKNRVVSLVCRCCLTEKRFPDEV